jgi:tetratricopeptide (TPR) repeat protein
MQSSTLKAKLLGLAAHSRREFADGVLALAQKCQPRALRKRIRKAADRVGSLSAKTAELALLAIRRPRPDADYLASASYSRRSRALRREGDLDTAETIVRQGLSRNPSDANLAQEYAEIAMAREDWSEAIRRWRTVLQVSGRNTSASVYARMSRAFRGAGEFNEADAIVGEAMRLHANTTNIAQEFAEIAMSSQNWVEAVKRWQKILDVSGNSSPPAVYARMSQAFRNQDKLEMAEVVLGQGLSIHPSNPNLAREWAELAMAREDWAEALKRWQTVLEVYGDDAPPAVYIGMSTALRCKGEIDAGLAIVNQGLSLNPHHVKLLRERSLVTTVSKASGARQEPERTFGRRLDSFIKSPKLRKDTRFIQACAFGMNFSHAKADKEIQWANRCRLSWLGAGREDTWLSLDEAGKVNFIRSLLEEITTKLVTKFGDRPLTMGISAGYDSRSILHFLRRIGVTPQTFTFGQVGDQDFDFVSLLSRRESLDTLVFDTSELEWRLEDLDHHASYTRDFPLSPRVLVGAFLDNSVGRRLEVNGHLGDALTGISQNLHQTWNEALRVFCKISDRFHFQQMFPSDELADHLPRRPFVDCEVLSYSHQLDLGYLEHQRMCPLNGPNVEYVFPFRDPQWVGFWLNRTPAETLGQRLWFLFLHSLNANEFIELNEGQCTTRPAALRQMTRHLYGSEEADEKINLSTVKKALPSQGTIHFCLFACHANNNYFRTMVEHSVARLRRRGIFDAAFIDSVVRHFSAREPNSDKMLNGLVSIDVMAEGGFFD